MSYDVNMTYEIVKYSPEFESQIIELQTKYHWGPKVDLNAAYLKWKYDQNPYMKPPRLIYMALCNGQVVGMRGIYGAKWQIGNPPHILPVSCAGDLVIAAEHRNRGLLTKIMRAALDDMANSGYQYVFSLSSIPVTILSSLATGWRSISSLQMLRWRETRKKGISYRVHKYANKIPPLLSLSNFVRRQGSKISMLSSVEKPDPFYSLDRNGERLLSKINPNVTVQQTPKPEEMAELVKRIASDGRIRHVRDQEYFSWRFRNPLSLYRFFFWGATKLEGYLILQKPIYSYYRGISIMDWEATSMQVRTDLLKAAICIGNFDSLSIWSATLPNGARMVLQNLGFKLLEETESTKRYWPTVLVRTVRDEMLKSDWIIANRSLLDLASWDLRMIYSDGY